MGMTRKEAEALKSKIKANASTLFAEIDKAVSDTEKNKKPEPSEAE